MHAQLKFYAVQPHCGNNPIKSSIFDWHQSNGWSLKKKKKVIEFAFGTKWISKRKSGKCMEIQSIPCSINNTLYWNITYIGIQATYSHSHWGSARFISHCSLISQQMCVFVSYIFFTPVLCTWPKKRKKNKQIWNLCKLIRLHGVGVLYHPPPHPFSLPNIDCVLNDGLFWSNKCTLASLL